MSKALTAIEAKTYLLNLYRDGNRDAALEFARDYWIFFDINDVRALFRPNGRRMFLLNLERAEAKLQKQPKPGRVIDADWILEIAV